MTRYLILFAIIVLAACTATPTYPVSEDLLRTGFSGIPKDAATVAERLAGCQHFAGEIGDNPPERELEIQSSMTELHCESIDQDVQAIRIKYSGSRRVQEALTSASEL